MRDFSKVSPSVWRSRKFKGLPDEAKFAFFALLAGEPARHLVKPEGIAALEVAEIIDTHPDGAIFWRNTLGCVPAPKGRMTGRARKWISNIVREIVYVRDKFKCVYCGATENLQLDHVKPHSKGGLDTPENLVTACKRCNCSKGAKHVH